jgi:transcriptional regulator with XRE-family HTH domain
MSKSVENLAQYVSRVMRQKGLSQRDVVSRAGEEIAGSYISGIVSGQIDNLSMNKFKALARGLGVSVVELFIVASGESVTATRSQQSATDISDFLELMRKVAEDPDLIEIVRMAVTLKAEERIAVLDSVRTFTDGSRKSKRRLKPD